MAIESVIYTAHATATGGRDGTAKSDDGKLDIKLGIPVEMGGRGDGSNPEQMFAVGYSACFIGALKVAAASQNTRLPSDTSIQAAVSFGPRSGGAKGFGLEVSMDISIPGIDRARAESLVKEAHEVCPYSNATRNNVDVRLTVV